MSWMREGNHEKAWNDPPVFSYDAALSAQAAKKRTPLNKRVAFPLSGPAGQSPPIAPGLGPPPSLRGAGQPPLSSSQGPPPAVPGQEPPPVMSKHGPCPVVPTQGTPPEMSNQEPTPVVSDLGPSPELPSNAVASLSASTTNHQPSEDTARMDSSVGLLDAAEVKAKLLSILDSVEEIEEKLKDDVRLRVEVLCRVIAEDRFSPPVRNRIDELVTALESGSTASADLLQRSLMVDYPGECGAWMPGIRQLIVHLGAVQTPARTDNRDQA